MLLLRRQALLRSLAPGLAAPGAAAGSASSAQLPTPPRQPPGPPDPGPALAGLPRLLTQQQGCRTHTERFPRPIREEPCRGAAGAAAGGAALACREDERFEQMREQVAELSLQCAGLTAQVRSLVEILHERGVGCNNLMERQAAQEGGKMPAVSQFRPSIAMVSNQPTHLSQLGSTPLLELAYQGSHAAHKERLLREIMQVDGVEWEEAHKRLYEMDVYNEKYYWICSMPYRFGISFAVLGALAGVLLVFHKPAVVFHASAVVGEKVPEDIENMTVNQVGSWAWSWMEPMIGTASFVLLCFQFARAQAWKLNMRPYTESMQRWRANRLARQFPQYETSVVRSWAKHMPMVKWNFFPAYRRFLGPKSI